MHNSPVLSECFLFYCIDAAMQTYTFDESNNNAEAGVGITHERGA